MALALRPNCEYCDKDLPPAARDAMICTFECTFCADCVDTKLFNVCPNCGGGFAPRPIRPATEWRPGLSVAKRPPSDKRAHLSLQPRRHRRAFGAHQGRSAWRAEARQLDGVVGWVERLRETHPCQSLQSMGFAALPTYALTYRLFGSNRFSRPFQQSA
jgi:hypothetical protein